MNTTAVKNNCFCIVQLTRIGDILQTIQAAEEFKTAYPDIKLVFVGRKTFSEPIRFLLEKTFNKISLNPVPTIPIE